MGGSLSDRLHTERGQLSVNIDCPVLARFLQQGLGAERFVAWDLPSVWLDFLRHDHLHQNSPNCCKERRAQKATCF